MDENRPPASSPGPQRPASASSSQCVVELLRVSSGGVVFWSRHPFEIACELQLRMSGNVLALHTNACKAQRGMVRGFVIECKPARRDDGSVGFEVAVLFDEVLAGPHQRHVLPRCEALPGMPVNPLGLN